MRAALQRQSELLGGGKDVDNLDPMCPLSFSCLDKQTLQTQKDLLAVYSEERHSAFNPLGPDGRPFRTYVMFTLSATAPLLIKLSPQTISGEGQALVPER